MPESRIKTLLIEDSGFMRIYLSDLLRSDERIELMGTAVNGLEGVRKVRALKPDVVVTDMVMPDYDGLYVVKELMKEMPLPIILLSSLDRTDPKIFDALREGAFDFVDKPRNEDQHSGYTQLSRLIQEASLVNSASLRLSRRLRNIAAHTFDGELNYDIIAIGASTGGPGAIEYIVNNIPANLPIPIVIVQHMPVRFLTTFAQRLAAETGLKVSVLGDEERLLGNHIYFAPASTNMRIIDSGGGPKAVYVHDKYREYNNPSVDCLFESVASVFGSRAIGVILTGMGKDGTRGLKAIRDAGGFTVVQDEDSCVVYGMPKSALESGAALHQVTLSEIPNFIMSAL
jgi:two-component system chemotaxis response regulator CheB